MVDGINRQGFSLITHRAFDLRNASASSTAPLACTAAALRSIPSQRTAPKQGTNTVKCDSEHRGRKTYPSQHTLGRLSSDDNYKTHSKSVTIKLKLIETHTTEHTASAHYSLLNTYHISYDQSCTAMTRSTYNVDTYV